MEGSLRSNKESIEKLKHRNLGYFDKSRASINSFGKPQTRTKSFCQILGTPSWSTTFLTKLYGLEQAL